METLKKWILINAAFSSICGIISLLFYVSIERVFGIGDSGFILELGMALLLFVALLLYSAYSSSIRPKLIYSIIVMDLTWVLVSLIIILLKLFDLESIAYSVIAMVSTVVGFLAWKQWQSLKQIQLN